MFASAAVILAIGLKHSIFCNRSRKRDSSLRSNVTEILYLNVKQNKVIYSSQKEDQILLVQQCYVSMLLGLYMIGGQQIASGAQ